MFSSRQFIRELQRLRQDVDAVGERIGQYKRMSRDSTNALNVWKTWFHAGRGRGLQQDPIPLPLAICCHSSARSQERAAEDLSGRW